MKQQAEHANCLIIGTRGLLIRGNSGCGKSSLSEVLIEAARAKGNRGILVADDRVFLTSQEGRVVANVPETLSGKFEVRGFGLVETPHQPVARVHLLIDLVPMETMERLPDAGVVEKTVGEASLAAMTCPANRPGLSLRQIRWGLRALFPGGADYI